MFDSKGQGATKTTGVDSKGGSANTRRPGCVSPFGETANPAEYVPRAATETALSELMRLVSCAQPAALISAPGLGKTLLLHVLAIRFGDRLRCVYLPYGAMALDELCAWALGRLDEAIGGDSREALLGYARAVQRKGASALVLLLDDANSLPHETAKALGKYIRASRRALRLVLAASDDSTSSRTLATLGPDVFEVLLTAPMSRRETHFYVRSRLAQVGVPKAICARFDTTALDRIYRLSAGVPRRVNEVAAWFASELPAGVHPSWRDQRWLGAPLDELSGEDATTGDLPGYELLEIPEELLDTNLE